MWKSIFIVTMGWQFASRFNDKLLLFTSSLADRCCSFAPMLLAALSEETLLFIIPLLGEVLKTLLRHKTNQLRWSVPTRCSLDIELISRTIHTTWSLLLLTSIVIELSDRDNSSIDGVLLEVVTTTWSLLFATIYSPMLNTFRCETQ
jgi:hypothetical protein